MKDTQWLQELDKLRQEQFDKADNLKGRYENGTLSQSSYETQMQGVENTIDILGNQIEEEVKKQGLSEQEYLEAREGWQEEEHSR
jgi:hypothetical protein